MTQAVLRKAPLFAGLDDDAATDLEASMRPVDLKRSQVLFREGEIGDRMYVVVDGKIKIGRSSADGRSTLLRLLGPGEMFGELTLFDPDQRSGTATAVVDARLYALSNQDLRGWVERRPEVAMSLLRQLSRRMRRSTEVVAELVFFDVPGRVARTLLELSTRFGTPHDDGMHVWHDLTQEELAQMVGASRETVNKALADFASRGWLRLEPRAVVLLDIDRIKQRAH